VEEGQFVEERWRSRESRYCLIIAWVEAWAADARNSIESWVEGWMGSVEYEVNECGYVLQTGGITSADMRRNSGRWRRQTQAVSADDKIGETQADVLTAGQGRFGGRWRRFLWGSSGG
jgi:hypothetical protein